MEKNNTDRFIAIAAGGKKLTGEIKRLKEITPVKIDHVILNNGQVTVPIREEKNEEDLYKEFLKELENTKKHFLPFLEKHSYNIKLNYVLLTDFLYRKETEEDIKDFNNVLNDKGEWKQIIIPYYIGITGRWNSFYKTNINFDTIDEKKEYIIRFISVDYQCDVYFNNRLLTSHTGFFSPFEVDITPYIRKGNNSLLLVVHNDLTTSGIEVNGFTHYGDKIYACTNVGYDEPMLGWHHCPAGNGVIGNIYLLTTSKQRVTDCFVETNIDNGEIKIHTTIDNYLYDRTDLKVSYLIQSRNFIDKDINGEFKVDTFQIGKNHIDVSLILDNFKLWTTNEPYLYDLTIFVKDDNGSLIDEYQTSFGMRKFTMDLNSKPLKGAFYFNNERIFLRGTNEMGHLPRDVMENNFDQLVDDILIAKVAGLNYFRMTQRPTLPVIYDYFDRLGMLVQSDFPLFSYITDSSLKEAYKQMDEMERLTRNHPSVIIESFCNETLDKTAWGKEQYVLSRLDMEKFFNISKEIIHLLNPSRVIKYNEGDYAPIGKTYGISDFHCYTYWYVSHGLPSGKLRKGYLHPIRKNYMTGCGEFGVDGLDSLDIMKKFAPQEWLPKNMNDPWSPKVIAKSQCFQLHGDFFKECKVIDEWIASSRNYQKEAIKEYVKSLRLRSDYIQSTCVHLLIDAWPMGWTKALIDVLRKPKPAFYAFKEWNIPLRVSLRQDKYVINQKDKARIEVYAYNDLANKETIECNVSIHYGKNIKNYTFRGFANPSGTTYLGDVIVDNSKFLGDVNITSVIKNSKYDSYDCVIVKILPNPKKAIGTPIIHGRCYKNLSKICLNKKLNDIAFIDQKYYLGNKETTDKFVKEGNTVFLTINNPIKVGDKEINFKVHTLEEEVRANNLIYPSKDNKYSKEFDINDFKNFYNHDFDYQDLTAWFKFYHDDIKEILYTLEDSKLNNGLNKSHKIIVGEFTYGKGKFIISTLSILEGGLSFNPVLDKFIINIINKK